MADVGGAIGDRALADEAGDDLSVGKRQFSEPERTWNPSDEGAELIGGDRPAFDGDGGTFTCSFSDEAGTRREAVLSGEGEELVVGSGFILAEKVGTAICELVI